MKGFLFGFVLILIFSAERSYSQGCAAPTATPGFRCAAGTVVLSASSASAGTFKWYSALTGGTLLRTSGAGIKTDNYTTVSIGSTTTYYVTYTGSCESSPRTPVVATINALPAAPSVTPGSRCGTGTVTLSAASGTAGIFKWYTALTGGTLLQTSAAGQTTNSYTTPSISATTTYYVVFNNGTCDSSPRVAVAATVNALPTAPAATPGSTCGTGTVNLSATSTIAGTFTWYTALTGGTVLQTSAAGLTSNSFITPSISATTTYYVTFKNGTCESSPRTAVVATFNALPTAPTITPGSTCGAGAITLAANSSVTGVFKWYSASTGGTPLQTSAAGQTTNNFTTPSLSATTTYYVTFSNALCESAPRTAITATVNSSSPATAPNVTAASRCGSGTVILSASSSTSGTFRWYNALNGGTLLQTSAAALTNNYTTPSLSATTTYYVTFNNGTCESTPRKPVVATINTIPTAPSVTPGSRCATGTVTLSAASGTAGIFKWYTALTGGTLLQTSAAGQTTNSYTTPSISATTTYYVVFNNGTCDSSPRVAVAATVNALPTAPAATPGSTCGTGTVNLSATSTIAGTFTWYSASTGGTALQTSAAGLTSNSFITPSISATTTYYVTFNNGTCESSPRIAVIATFNALPASFTVSGGGALIQGSSPTRIITLNSGQSSANYQLQVNGVNSGAPLVGTTTPSWTVSSEGTYTVLATLGTCSIPMSGNAVVTNGLVSDAMEFQALKDLFSSTNGANWTNKTNWPTTWPASVTNAEFGTWFGVTVTNGDVTGISLSANNLTGNLLPSIGLFSKLDTFNIRTNQIGGPVPAEINSLTSLTQLQLGPNDFTGDLPYLGSLINLTALEISVMPLNPGPIPSWVQNLTLLRTLALQNSRRTGLIPAFIWNLTNLSLLYLDTNSLTGSIPPAIQNLTNLTSFTAMGNQLTGSIPHEIGSLTNLVSLQLNNNQLSGEVPIEIGNLSKMESLYLFNNQLSGQFPSTIGNLTKLKYLFVWSNQLTGSLPGTLGNCKALIDVAVNDNQLTSLEEFDLLPNIRSFNIGNNKFTGSVPVWIAQKMPYLDAINISDNNFSGDLPSSIADLADLGALSFRNNQITGSLPDPTKFTRLGQLYANGNKLSGTIQSGYSALNLSQFHISNNQFSGNFPNITNWTSLSYLFISGNQFTGAFPSVTGLNSILYIEASSNKFVSLPNSVLSLPNAYFINFSYNELMSVANLSSIVNNSPIAQSVQLGSFYLSQNYLGFNDLLPIKSALGSRLIYTPQKTINDITAAGYVNGGSLVIAARDGGANSTMLWEKQQPNGTWLNVNNLNQDATQKTFARNLATTTDDGVYRWTTSNSTITDLTLQSVPITVGNQGNVLDQVEYNALKDLYMSTNGANWTNKTNWPTIWPTSATSTEFGTWFGVWVLNGDVVRVDLPNNNLVGTVPNSIGNLNRMWFLGLNSNPQLGGNLPSTLNQLTELSQLSLSNAGFSGVIPDLSLLVKLQSFDISENTGLTAGPVPAWLNAPNITNFGMRSTNRTGAFPAFQNAINLFYIDLTNNQLSGALPSFAVGTLPKLKYLFLHTNQITSIPEEIGNLTSLETLLMGWNQLTGPLPNRIGDLTNLSNIHLYYNQLSGQLPSTLGNLSKLQYLYIWSNQFTGTLPVSLGNCKALIELAAENNQLSELGDLGIMPSLQYFGVNNNKITGTVPAWLGAQPLLRVLYLQNNKFSGDLPISFGSLSNLYSLTLTNNQITGGLPDPANLVTLRSLDVSGNKMSGSIQPGYSARNFVNFNITGNQFSGSFPNISNWINLSTLIITGNRFTGAFPSVVGLNSLTFIEATGNQFTSLPNSILSVPNAYYISFENNQLRSVGNLATGVSNGTIIPSPALGTFFLDQNYLGFNDLMPIKNAMGSRLIYTPQKPIDDNTAAGYVNGGSLVISARDGGANSTMLWEKQQPNGTWLNVNNLNQDATQKTFTRTLATVADDGIYRWTTSNSTITDLTLQSVPITVNNQGNVLDQVEYNALKDLYMSTNGANWTNKTNWPTIWPTSATSAEFGTWFGVTVTNGDVTGVNLYQNALSGLLSLTIGDLKQLQTLNLAANYVTGTIPPSLWTLVNLKSLDLFYDRLTGSLPPAIGNMVNLEHIDLSNMLLSGVIPTEITSLVNLKRLNLGANSFGLNNFVGPIPTNIGNMKALEELNLRYNSGLTGGIPSSIASLNNLYSFSINGVPLNGPLPEALFNLPKLGILYAPGCGITSLPVSIPTTSLISQLDLSGNQLTGNIPFWIGDLHYLYYLNLSQNQLSGSIPSSVGNLTNVRYFYLYNNQLTGEIPASVSNMTSLAYLYISNNQLTGPLPDFSRVPLLAQIIAYNNQLSGSVLTSRFGTAMVDFQIQANQFSGPLPDINHWPNISGYLVAGNQFTGSFPSFDPGLFPNLFYINASGNKLTSIPAAVLSIGNYYMVFADNLISEIRGLTEAPANSIQPDPNLNFWIQNNQLDFTQLEKLKSVAKPNFIYAPQNPIKDISVITFPSGGLLQIGARPLTPSTTITWEKQQAKGTWVNINSQNQDATQKTFTKAAATASDEGYYRWTMTNSLVTNITLQSDPIFAGAISSITSAKTLYNGLITSARWRTDKAYGVAESDLSGMYLYDYDEKYQLKEAVFANPNFTTNTYQLAGNNYRLSGMQYDPNGNIQALKRFKDNGQILNDFGYTYKPNTNQLTAVSGYANYTYNAIGQMVSADKVATTEKDQYVEYDVTGKVVAVYADASKTQLTTHYKYDDRGFRMAKVTYPTPGSAEKGKTTWYVRDASGNILSIYEQEVAMRPGAVGYPIEWTNLVNATASGEKLISGGGQWDSSGARSTQQLTGGKDGWIEFAYTNENSYSMFGFAEAADGMYPTFSIYATNNSATYSITVFENGRGGHNFELPGKLNEGAILRIERVGTAIYYKLNGTTFYTSNYNTSSTLWAKAAFASGPGSNGVLVRPTCSFDAAAMVVKQTEIPIYGAGKLGTYYASASVAANQASIDAGTTAYEITDHLGNVRAVVRTQANEYTATLEDDGTTTYSNPRVRENIYFKNLFNTEKRDAQMNHTTSAEGLTGSPTNSSYLYWVNGQAGITPDIKSVGPAIALTVTPGDWIDLSAWARFKITATYNKAPLRDIIAGALAGNFVNSNGLETITQATNIFNTGLLSLVSNSDAETDRPYAYLNYIVYGPGNTMPTGKAIRVPLTAGFNEAERSNPYTAANNLIKVDPINITQAGFIYIWVSNESENTEVWFDDVNVVHHKPIVAQATDYGAWGDVLREQKWIDLDAKYRWAYQGQYAEKDEETGWNHYELREYDPLTGRMITTDPYGEFWSSYMGMGNDPINNTDPDGGFIGYERQDNGSLRKVNNVGGNEFDVIYNHDGTIEQTFLSAITVSAGMSQSSANAARLGIYQGQHDFMNHPVTEGAMFGLGFFTGGSEAFLLGRLGTGLKVARGPLRLAYQKTVKELAKVGDDMLANSYSKEATAKTLHYLRRRVGVIFKEQTPILQRGIIYVRNYLKYGDKLGPSFHRLRQSGKSFDDIIESASRPGGKDLFK